MGFEYLWILLTVSGVLCAVGFYKYVYFISIGYGFAVAGIGFALAIMSIMGIFHAGIPHYILFLLFIVYGLRLSSFLIIRETKNIAYRKTLKVVSGDEANMRIIVKAVIWVCVSVLYVAQTSPVFFIIYNGGKSSTVTWAGIGICMVALIIESVADRQKSKQKRIRSDMVAMGGLYKIVRCPNYFGEILFWTGVFVSSLDILRGWGQWLTAAIAYVCIVYIMFSGAQRLEKRQMKSYVDNVEYNNYADRTPIIIPFIPVYHLNKKRIET
jgi:steroid 5-alpha reductase family enzyme